jgi:capsular polysaccharide biosynthesis protein
MMIEHDALDHGTRPAAPFAGKRRKIEPVRVIRSPAFVAAYPRITNPELIEPGIRAAMEPTWSTVQFAERNVEVFSVKSGYVIDENLVLDHNLQIVANVDDWYSPEELQRAVGDVERRLEAKDLPHIEGVGIVAKRRAANNYGHYLLYMVPLAFLGKRLFGDRNPRYLVHRTSPPMVDVTLRSLRLLGINLESVLMLDFREPVLFEEVVFFTGLAEHGTYLSPLAVQAVVDMAASVPAGPSCKLFVRRIPGWRRGREMKNEEDIARRLAIRGFHVIQPGSMRLEEQIAAFKGAECVVGSMGAGMANIVFCQPGTRVTTLSSGMFPDTFFWFVATHRGLQYQEIRGDPLVSDDVLGPTAVSFTIREQDILALEAS